VAGPLLHLDLIAIAPTASPEARTGLVEAATALNSIPGVDCLLIIEAEAASDFDLALLISLTDARSLEPFGTDQRYTRFLQTSVAPLLGNLAGADLQLEAPLEASDGHAACLAIAAAPQTYDWEVRKALDDWLTALNPRASVLGLAYGDKQRFRGGAIAVSQQPLTAARPTDRHLAPVLIAGSLRRLA
jgi:hypothetical protein